MLLIVYLAAPSGLPGAGRPAVGAAGAPAVAAGATPVAAAAPVACPTGDVAEAVARDAARHCRAKVGIAELTSEYDQAWAMPDGSVRYEHRYRPVRVKRDGRWTPVDTKLAFAADGSVRPGATATGLVFSGGGDGPMVAVAEGAGTLRLGSPVGPLPRPALDGDTATYPEVLPGVDLQLKADVDGYSQVLVVKSREAAANPKLDRLAFSVAADGLTVAADSAGNLRAADAKGKVVLAGNAPLMWDAGAARVRAMRTSLAKASLVVMPDRAMLDAAATRYPVYIDPGVTAARSNWVKVDSGNPTVNYLNASGNAPVGTNNGGTNKYRSFFDLDVSVTPIAGKYISSAYLAITETHSASCTPRQVDLWNTGYAGATTTWNAQPAWGAILSSQTVAGGFSTACPAAALKFDATAIVRSAAAGSWGNVTVALRSPNETDNSYYKTFSNNPTLVINYLHYAPVAGCPGGIAVDSDYNGDGAADVAIGAPFAAVNGLAEAGQVTVQYAGSGQTQTLSQGTAGVPDVAEAGDQFGFSLASYDANQDGCADLVAGAPYEDAGTVPNSGGVAVLFGGPAGLARGVWYDQGSADLADDPGNGDWLGYAVAAGNTPSGEPFLAMGAPGEDLTGTDSGIVHYRLGSSNATVGGTGTDDRAGYSLAATPHHLAIGLPGRTDGAGRTWSGAVFMYTHAISGTSVKSLAQVAGGTPNGTTGKSIDMVPIAGTTNSLLAIGSPGGDGDGVRDSGAASTYILTSTGFTVVTGVRKPDAKPGDHFGEKVTLSPGPDQTLVVGAPGHDDGDHRDAGSVIGFPAAGTGAAVPIRTGDSAMALDGAYLHSSRASLYLTRFIAAEVTAYSWSSIGAGAPAVSGTWQGSASFGSAVR
ncbi:hypothetical protein Ade02nite_81810 [Paractinoplanes deccanensis]|uniref:Carbohydrate-binding module family 96 domain-containing protein n=1 Tax=Paractinoplanes deccanensis TaxID=113561 RepID=A0ABQ3YHY5_9ACTN|nr:DNRLRE domain-containing protein [Actinoplanes deccanensis]GID79540.1 hypothetical protein Ade02nite_81810 [Actinoplanes deccanensis]